MRDKANDGINYLLPFNEHDRNRAWDRTDEFHNLIVPPAEHVTIPSLWVAEMFPPSELPALLAAIAKRDWDRKRRLWGSQDSNAVLLDQSRGGAGWGWWKLADIVPVGSTKFVLPDAVRAKLPPEFRHLSLTVMQLGQGLTAVVAQFWLTDDARRVVDTVWHSDHEPQLVRRKGARPLAEDRQWSAYRLTQEARYALHNAARDWMRRECPGYFAAADDSQTLLDMMVMDVNNPLSANEPERAIGDPFRALGVTEHGFLRRTSRQVPQFELVPTDLRMTPALKTRRTWAVWAQRESAASALGEKVESWGSTPDDAFANRYSLPLQGFLLTAAVGDFLEVAERRHASLRDSARAQHGRFKAEALDDLRDHLLTLSLDVSSVQRDLAPLWKAVRAFPDEALFVQEDAPYVRAQDEQPGRTPREPINLNEAMRAAQMRRPLVASRRLTGTTARFSQLKRRGTWSQR